VWLEVVEEYCTPSLVLFVTGLVDRVSLEVAIAKLPQGYKRVFELHDVLGYEHKRNRGDARFFRSAIRSRNCTKPVCACANFSEQASAETRVTASSKTTAEVAASFDDVPPPRTEISLSLAASAVCFEGEL